MLKHIREASYPLVSLPRYAKRIIVLSVDISLCVLTVWLAFYLRLGDFVTLSGPALWAVAIAVAIALPYLWFLGYIALFFATRVFLQFLQ